MGEWGDEVDAGGGVCCYGVMGISKVLFVL